MQSPSSKLGLWTATLDIKLSLLVNSLADIRTERTSLSSPKNGLTTSQPAISSMGHELTYMTDTSFSSLGTTTMSPLPRLTVSGPLRLTTHPSSRRHLVNVLPRALLLM